MALAEPDSAPVQEVSAAPPEPKDVTLEIRVGGKEVASDNEEVAHRNHDGYCRCSIAEISKKLSRERRSL